MPTVWYRERRVVSGPIPRFHRTKDCHNLTKRPPRGTPNKLVEVDLSDVPLRMIPCRACYPDAPPTKIFKRYCYICKPHVISPCVHNGGVQVLITQPGFTLQGEYWPTHRDPCERRRWVWPERAYRYQKYETTD